MAVLNSAAFDDKVSMLFEQTKDLFLHRYLLSMKDTPFQSDQ